MQPVLLKQFIQALLYSRSIFAVKACHHVAYVAACCRSDQFVVLMLKKLEQHLCQVACGDVAQMEVLIEVEHCGITGQVIVGHRFPGLGHPCNAFTIKFKLAIALGVAVDKQALAITQVEQIVVVVHIDGMLAKPAVLIKIADVKALFPYQMTTVGVVLYHTDSVEHMDARGYDRHSLLLDPHVTEGLRAVLGVKTVEFDNQVIPRSIAVGISAEVAAQALTQGVGALVLLEFAHHDGRLVVDDVAIEQACLIQVV